MFLAGGIGVFDCKSQRITAWLFRKPTWAGPRGPNFEKYISGRLVAYGSPESSLHQGTFIFGFIKKWTSLYVGKPDAYWLNVIKDPQGKSRVF